MDVSEFESRKVNGDVRDDSTCQHGCVERTRTVLISGSYAFECPVVVLIFAQLRSPMQKPIFYRERARVAENLAKLCRDETAKQMLQRVAERWRELARLAGPQKASRAARKAVSVDALRNDGRFQKTME